MARNKLMHRTAQGAAALLLRLTSGVRFVVTATIGLALLAPSSAHEAQAAMTVTPGFVKNVSKVTLAMSGYNAAHDHINTVTGPVPAATKVLQITGPSEGASSTYQATNVRISGGKLLADVNFATGTLGAGPGTYTVKFCEVVCPTSPPSPLSPLPAPPVVGHPTEDLGTFVVLADPVAVDTPAVPKVVSRAATTNLVFTGLFAKGVTAYSDSPLVQVGTPTPLDGTHVKVPVTTTDATPAGRYTLTVRNTDGTTDSCYKCLRVSDFNLTSHEPTVLSNAAGRKAIRVTGLDLPPSAQLVGALVREPEIPGQEPILSKGVQPQSSTDWTGYFDLADAAPGVYRLRLTAEDDASVGLCTCVLTVQVNDLPTISSVGPSALGQGAKDVTLTVTGTNFPHGATLSVPTASKVSLGETQWIDSKTLATKVTVEAAAPLGKVDVTVTNPAAPGTFTCVGCLVVNPHPKIVSLSPDTLTQGDTHRVLTLTGEQFNADTRLVADAGVAILSATFVDTRHFELTVSVADTARGGLHTITATNLDGGTSGAVSALSVQRVVLATLTQSRTTTKYGEAVALSGAVTYRDNGSPAAGQGATLMATPGGDVAHLALGVTTDSSGNWRYTDVPERNTTYQLAVTAAGGAPATSSVVRVAVSPRISITSPRPSSSSSQSKPLAVAGLINPSTAGPVLVYARDARGRVAFARRVTPDSRGRFVASLPLRAGTYRLFATTAKSTAYASGSAPSVAISRT